jgi:DNA-binding transcriptional MerR regulator
MSPNTERPSNGDEDELMRRYGIDLNKLREMYAEWNENGVPKSVVEARYLRTRRFHGKLFSRLVREYLGVETEHPHPLRRRIEELTDEVSQLRRENDELRTQLNGDCLIQEPSTRTSIPREAQQRKHETPEPD